MARMSARAPGYAWSNASHALPMQPLVARRCCIYGPVTNGTAAAALPQDELAETVPKQLTQGIENPAPPPDDPVWSWMV